MFTPEVEVRFTQRLGNSGVSLCFPGLPGIISEKASVVFFSVCDCVPAKHGITPKIFGGSLSSVKHPSMLEHSLRLVLSQGIQGDHLPPLDLLGSRITGDSLSPLASPREGGIGPLFIPSRA